MTTESKMQKLVNLLNDACQAYDERINGSN